MRVSKNHYDDLLPYKEIIVELRSRLSIENVTKEVNALGVITSRGHIRSFLFKIGATRKKTCEFCQIEAIHTNGRIRWCKNCVPNSKSGAHAVKYGISFIEYSERLKLQKNACAICEVSFETARSCVDHCHETGKFRGILCFRCNRDMSVLDATGWLERALRYKDA